MEYSPAYARSRFPALAAGGVFFDGPGGTQVPQEVFAAVSGYYRSANANEHGLFATSRRSDEIINSARESMADFINARSANEIIFGANMTTLTFQLARALGRRLQPGDEIVVTRLDHDANIAPWLYLQEQGAVIRWLEFNPSDCTLDLSVLEQVINKKTKIVAVGYASNAFGTINDVPGIIVAAKKVGALTFIDVVHYAPHRAIDVQALDCDFLACSPYKFYGPHAGVLYGKQEILAELVPYKVRPAAEHSPDCFETGTKNHEGLAGVAAAVDFLSWLGETYGQTDNPVFAGYAPGRRRFLKQAMAVIKTHESRLFLALLAGVRKIPGIRLYGITDSERIAERTPTLAFTLAGKAPAAIARLLGEQGVYVWEGNYYAWEAMRFLGLEEKGGAVRVGLCLYNSNEEVEYFLASLGKIAAGA